MVNGYRIENVETIIGYQRRFKVIREDSGDVIGEGECFVDALLVKLNGPDIISRECEMLAERYIP